MQSNPVSKLVLQAICCAKYWRKDGQVCDYDGEAENEEGEDGEACRNSRLEIECIEFAFQLGQVHRLV